MPQMRVFWEWLDQFECWHLMTEASRFRLGPDFNMGFKTYDEEETPVLETTFAGDGHSLLIDFIVDLDITPWMGVTIMYSHGGTKYNKRCTIEFLTEGDVERALTRLILIHMGEDETTGKAISLLYVLAEPETIFM
jgi:hypothetical protein